MKNKVSTSKKPYKKKATKATWKDSKSESDENVDTASILDLYILTEKWKQYFIV